MEECVGNHCMMSGIVGTICTNGYEIVKTRTDKSIEQDLEQIRGEEYNKGCSLYVDRLCGQSTWNLDINVQVRSGSVHR